MFTVTVTEKDGPSETHTFDKTEVGIGRVKGNDIVLPKGNVSKRHSRIVVKDGKFIVVDLKSTNGTYVNGRKITSPQVIKTVDKVYIGDFIIAVAESAAPAPAKAKEEVAATSDIQSMSPSGMSAKTPSSKPQPSTPKKAAKRPSAQKESPAAEPKAKLETVRRTPTMAAPNLGPSQQRPSSTTPAKVMRGAATNTASASSSSVKAPAVQAVSAPSAPALELHTPGAGGVPPKPQFKSEFDEAFAKNQRTAAEAFFQSIDPSTLTLHYPPSPEDRTAIEGSVKEIAKAAGGGDDLFEHLMSEATELGPLENLLNDPTIEEIYVNSFDRILVRRNGAISTTARAYSHPEFLYLAAQRLLSARPEPRDEPADEVRFSDGTRIHILMPPLAPNGPVLTVRKAQPSVRTLDDLVAENFLSANMGKMLKDAVEAGRSIVIGGVNKEGRTQLLGAIASLVAEGTRLVVAENISTLRLPQHSAVYLEEGHNQTTRFNMSYLIKSAMRMLPDRVIVDSLSGPEAFDWVCAAAAGTFGSMATCSGVSTADVLGRLQAMALMGAHNVTPRGLRDHIAKACHVVVVVHQLPDGNHRVQQISEVQGIDLDKIRSSDVFYFRAEGDSGQFVATGHVPTYYENLRAAGINADTQIFSN